MFIMQVSLCASDVVLAGTGRVDLVRVCDGKLLDAAVLTTNSNMEDTTTQVNRRVSVASVGRGP